MSRLRHRLRRVSYYLSFCVSLRMLYSQSVLSILAHSDVSSHLDVCVVLCLREWCRHLSLLWHSLFESNASKEAKRLAELYASQVCCISFSFIADVLMQFCIKVSKKAVYEEPADPAVMAGNPFAALASGPAKGVHSILSLVHFAEKKANVHCFALQSEAKHHWQSLKWRYTLYTETHYIDALLFRNHKVSRFPRVPKRLLLLRSLLWYPVLHPFARLCSN